MGAWWVERSEKGHCFHIFAGFCGRLRNGNIDLNFWAWKHSLLRRKCSGNVRNAGQMAGLVQRHASVVRSTFFRAFALKCAKKWMLTVLLYQKTRDNLATISNWLAALEQRSTRRLLKLGILQGRRHQSQSSFEPNGTKLASKYFCNFV